MRKLETIQTQNKLNDVYAVDEPGIGGANHRYIIVKHGAKPEKVGGGHLGPEFYEFNGADKLASIRFQTGARDEEGSRSGVLGVDLLEIVRDTLVGFQSGEFANEYNQEALAFVETALLALNRRIEDRAKRGVLGHNKK